MTTYNVGDRVYTPHGQGTIVVPDERVTDRYGNVLLTERVGVKLDTDVLCFPGPYYYWKVEVEPVIPG